jgi:transposase
LGNPTEFFLTQGQACDLDGSDALLPTITAMTVLADRAYDAEERVLEPLRAAGKQIVIPPKRNRIIQRDYDKDLYKARHLIENFFCKLKQFRAIATRYDKTAQNFLAAIYLASAIIWLN